MRGEHGSSPEIKNSMSTVEETVEFILKTFSEYRKEDLEKPIGDEQTSLGDFLRSKKDGSEWTDPHGFKINVVGDEYKLTIT